MRIKLLPDEVVNRIAAGEVIERPQSVVRELVDNALDSGATEIVVTLEDGGLSLISVRDNGSGMSKDDAVLAFERHATSKVSELDDLWSLSTYGFRGEALSSIASVARVRLRTRRADSEIGTEIRISGGQLEAVEPAAFAAGTEMEVRRLFFNVPARRKFLKSARAELARIKTWLLQSAIARPEVRYQLISDSETLFTLPVHADSLIRAKSLIRGNLEECSSEIPGLKVIGLVAHPGEAKADLGGLVFHVNSRLVQDKLMFKAVRDGFESTLKDYEAPIGWISVTIDPRAVDVNVHPQKSEVRFADSSVVFQAVKRAVSGAVKHFKGPVASPQVFQSTFYSPPPLRPPFQTYSPAPFSSFGNSAIAEPRFSYAQQEVFRTEPLSFHDSNPAPALPPSQFRFQDLRYVGQIFGCYLVCENEGKLIMVDMHAAHERVNYNRIKKVLEEKKIHEQKLLLPEEISLSPEEIERLREISGALQELAITLEFTESSAVVRGVPALFGEFNIPEFIRDLAEEPFTDSALFLVRERVNKIAARKACHASIRSGDLLSQAEVHALFHSLDNTEFSGACPHGRPVVVSFKESDVEKWFGRDK